MASRRFGVRLAEESLPRWQEVVEYLDIGIPKEDRCRPVKRGRRPEGNCKEPVILCGRNVELVPFWGFDKAEYLERDVAEGHEDVVGMDRVIYATDVYVGLAIVCIVVGVLLIWWLAR